MKKLWEHWLASRSKYSDGTIYRQTSPIAQRKSPMCTYMGHVNNAAKKQCMLSLSCILKSFMCSHIQPKGECA